jgi:hypothetical protein
LVVPVFYTVMDDLEHFLGKIKHIRMP